MSADEEWVAPVVPLFGRRSTGPRFVPEVPSAPPAPRTPRAFSEQWWTEDAEPEPTASAPHPAPDSASPYDQAERTLLRSLGSRGLSVSEARELLARRGHEAEIVDEVIAACERRGYLDDAVLAENLVRTASERQGKGRRAIATALAKRGVDRDAVDRALADLPDDDAERAADYARAKAPGLSRLDRDTAVRRLAGQLARRGYPSSVALNAARTALEEFAG